MDASSLRTVGILGGTGPQGRGLARRLGDTGLDIVIGSRSAERAVEVASELTTSIKGTVAGASNEAAALAGDIVLITVPWAGHAELLKALGHVLAGKIVVDCVNPLGFDRNGPHVLDVPEGSATQQAAALLPDSTVVGAFHNVSAVLLGDEAIHEINTDVLVLGDDRPATDLVEAVVDRIPGMRGVYGGRLHNARQVEALTANLISANKRYKAHAGIRITDVVIER